MTPLEIINEWRQGCSVSGVHGPETCHECTRNAMEALEKALSHGTSSVVTQTQELSESTRAIGEALSLTEQLTPPLPAVTLRLRAGKLKLIDYQIPSWVREGDEIKLYCDNWELNQSCTK